MIKIQTEAGKKCPLEYQQLYTIGNHHIEKFTKQYTSWLAIRMFSSLHSIVNEGKVLLAITMKHLLAFSNYIPK